MSKKKKIEYDDINPQERVQRDQWILSLTARVHKTCLRLKKGKKRNKFMRRAIEDLEPLRSKLSSQHVGLFAVLIFERELDDCPEHVIDSYNALMKATNHDD